MNISKKIFHGLGYLCAGVLILGASFVSGYVLYRSFDRLSYEHNGTKYSAIVVNKGESTAASSQHIISVSISIPKSQDDMKPTCNSNNSGEFCINPIIPYKLQVHNLALYTDTWYDTLQTGDAVEVSCINVEMGDCVITNKLADRTPNVTTITAS